MSKIPPLQTQDGTYIFSLSSSEPVEITLPAPVAHAEEIQELIDRFIQSKAEVTVVTDRDTVEYNDSVLVNLHCKLGGEEVPNLSGDQLSFTLGQNMLPAEIEQVITGMKVGDHAQSSFMFNLDEALGMPSEQPNELLLEFDVTILEIQNRILPALTDAWVHENFSEVSTVRDLERALAKDIIEQKIEQLKAEVAPDLICTELVKRLNQYIPEELYQKGVADTLRNYELACAQENMTLEQYAQLSSMSLEDLKKELEISAREGVEKGIALDCVSRDLNFHIEDEDIPELLNFPPQDAQHMLERLKTEGVLEEARQAASRCKAMRFLVEEAHIHYEEQH